MFQAGDIVTRCVTENNAEWSAFCKKMLADPTGNYVVQESSKDTISLCGDKTRWLSSKFTYAHLKVRDKEPAYTGGSVDYYSAEITNPTSGGNKYTAECNDIIEALGMNYAEGNAFKALWRRAAHRTLGKHKKGYPADGLYDAEKVEFFGARLVAQSKGLING